VGETFPCMPYKYIDSLKITTTKGCP
jgi:hypothetical protein